MNAKIDAPSPPDPCAGATGALDAEALNRACACVGVEPDALRRALEAEPGGREVAELLAQRCPHVFAALPVFVPEARIREMAAVVAAVEAVAALPAYRDAVLGNAQPVARHVPAALGVFFGYDFHVSPAGVGLIEINTNAGGAMLNAALARAQQACCPQVEGLLALGPERDITARIAGMFGREWALSRGTARCRTVAIVDSAPAAQYLYPEFLMFRRLFERHGMQAVIADPAELTFRDGALWHADTVVDMAYNRLTDFMLEEPHSSALRQAWLADAVVLTPHPHAHALYADKRNLAILSDPARLAQLGVPADIRQHLLATVPFTREVSAANAEQLWSERRRLFFKPSAGYGGRASYRGDKLTRRAWGDILAGSYVAQSLVLPGERTVADAGGTRQLLKYDVRNYAYEGRVLSLAARLYQGQTTNFRTPGGGFAPVYRWPG